MSATRRIVHSLFATGFGNVVTIVVQLGGVPLFLHFWGVEKYGQWLILSAVPTYLALTHIGFANAAANDMTASAAGGRRDAAVKTFQSMLVVILLACVVSGLAAVVVILLQTGLGFLPVKGMDAATVAAVIALFWGQVAIGQLAGLVSAGYWCDGNYALGTFLSNAESLGEFVALAICLVAGGGFVAAAAWVLVARSLGTFAYAVGLHWRNPWLTLGVREASLSEVKRLLRPAVAFMAFPVGNALYLQGFVLVVGWLVGGPAVVLFSTYRTMTRFPLQMMGMINNSVWPELSRSFGEGNVERARRLHRLAVASAVWVVLIADAAIVLLGATILRLWTGGQIPYERGLFFVLAGVVVANSAWNTSSVVPMSINRFESIAVGYLVGAAAALALSVGLGRLDGLLGIASALYVVDVLMSFLVLPRSLALTEDTLPDFVRRVVVPPFRSIAVALRRSQ